MKVLKLSLEVVDRKTKLWIIAQVNQIRMSSVLLDLYDQEPSEEHHHHMLRVRVLMAMACHLLTLNTVVPTRSHIHIRHPLMMDLIIMAAHLLHIIVLTFNTHRQVLDTLQRMSM